jgi:pyruvate formate lyase activating enzyme
MVPDLTGFVFNIQRFSIHDGPGIRSTVFLSGCPLRCFWCHNPEGYKRQPQVQFFPEKCILCGECLTIFQQQAHKIEGNLHSYDRDRCVRCGECIAACCSQAMQFTAQELSVSQVVEEVLRDQPFYDTSGGGVTLSGGDPLLQRGFSRALLQACQDAGIQTAIETSAYCRWEDLEELLPYVNLVMMDIKTLDEDKHTQATGVSNKLILSNAQKLADTGIPLIFRIPVIPTVNDTPDEIAEIANFISSLRVKNISLELLPFHRLAGDKYRSLDLDYRAHHLESPNKEQMRVLLESAHQYIPQAIAR